MLLKSSVGRKMLMALAGMVWLGFVLGHMAGNLLIFISPQAYNEYGHAITSNKPLLFGTEAALLFSILAHVFIGVTLTIENRKASPKKYATAPKGIKKGSLASRTMAVQGTFLLAFIIYHLITFKYGPEYLVTYDGVEMRDLHRLIMEVFQSPLYVFGYIFCLLLLGMHLSHGSSSIFQSMGFNHPKYTPVVKVGGFIYATIVTIGFIAQPLYVYMNL